MEKTIKLKGKSLTFELEFDIGNDSFDHEFGTEKLPDYVYVSDIIYPSGATDEEKEFIDKWVDNNEENLCEEWDEDDDYFDEPDPDDVYHREMQLLDKHGL